MAGWRSKLFGISSAQSPWVNIPELRGVPHARAFYAYERANARLKWGRAWCAGLLAATLVIVGWAILNPLLDRAFGRIIALFWIKCLVQALVTVLSVRLFQKITHQSLRRSIRAELGSHCSRCDYDLRGMPDAIPPAVARCPECGKPIPRNVHRQTMSGSTASNPAAAALLRRKGSE